MPGRRPIVVSHEREGSHANEELGLARAKAVCGYLRAHGVKGTFSTASRGETRPRASNRTARGRALNRRVELTVTRR